MAETALLPPAVEALPQAIRKIADTARAANEVIREVGNLLDSQERSIVVEVANLTGRTLTKVGHTFDGGGFGPTLPQATIPPAMSNVFSVRSSGLATGVDAMVTYHADGAGEFSVACDNPFVGTNSVNVFSNPNADQFLSILGATSNGNHSHARFDVIEKSRVPSTIDPPQAEGRKIAFNRHDRFVATMRRTDALWWFIVTTDAGGVFVHKVNKIPLLGIPVISDAVALGGSKVGFNPGDRFLVTMGTRIIVITGDGDAFGHDTTEDSVGPAFKFTGSKVAFNGVEDRYVYTMGNTIVVTRQDGGTFGHIVQGRDIGAPFAFRGSRVAFNPGDHFVFTVGEKIVVTTRDGGAFGHDVIGGHIFDAFAFAGSRVAFNPQDRFVVAIGSHIYVITTNGAVFRHDIR